jgi:hypothetical protein
VLLYNFCNYMIAYIFVPSLQIFIGQVMGTSVGTLVFVKFGWRAAAGLNMALYGFQLFVLLLRGPHCKQYTWFGYEGGLEPRKSVVDEQKRLEAEESLPFEKGPGRLGKRKGDC